MESIIKTYNVKVVREPGQDPLTGQYMGYGEQAFEVDATSVRAAYCVSNLVCTLPFRGQLRRTFINDEEYFDERY